MRFCATLVWRLPDWFGRAELLLPSSCLTARACLRVVVRSHRVHQRLLCQSAPARLYPINGTESLGKFVPLRATGPAFL